VIRNKNTNFPRERLLPLSRDAVASPSPSPEAPLTHEVNQINHSQAETPRVETLTSNNKATKAAGRSK
jgi:hypothetical protein